MRTSSPEPRSPNCPLPSLPKHHWALRHLPPFPAVATRLLRLLNNPHASYPEFAEVVESDPSFAWEVLKAANSPLLGLSREVNEIRHAVALLGVEQVKGLVMMTALSREFRHAFREPKLVDCWKHCLAVAHLSAALAPQYGIDAGVAYTAGLLHDLGRIALMTAFPRKYASLIEESFNRSIDIRILERQFFEIDHCEAGASMMLTWSLPPSLAEVCLRHHEPASTNAPPLLANVSAANRSAHLSGFQPVYEDESASNRETLEPLVPHQASPTPEMLHRTIDACCLTL